MQQKRHGSRIPFMVLCVLALIAGDLVVRRMLERGPYLPQPSASHPPAASDELPADSASSSETSRTAPSYGAQPLGTVAQLPGWDSVDDPGFAVLDGQEERTEQERQTPEVAYFPGYAFSKSSRSISRAAPAAAPSRESLPPQLLPAPAIDSLPLPVPVGDHDAETGTVIVTGAAVDSSIGTVRISDALSTSPLPTLRDSLAGRVAITDLAHAEPSRAEESEGGSVNGRSDAPTAAGSKVIESTTARSDGSSTAASDPASSSDGSPQLAPPRLTLPDGQSPVDSQAVPRQPAPIAADPDRQAIKSILLQEMPEASADDRAIWLETFRGFPPETVRELLKLRREHSALLPPRLAEPHGSARRPGESDVGKARIRDGHDPRDGHDHDTATRPGESDRDAPSTPSTERLAPAPTELDVDQPTLLQPGPLPHAMRTPRRGVGPDVDAYSAPPGYPEQLHMVPAAAHPSLAAITAAREVVLSNIANAQTAGFKRDRLVMINGSGERTPRLRVQQHVDFAPGKLRHTGRVLDLAISGEGLFAVSNGRQTFYTRCGQFELDRRGRIVLPESAPRQQLTEPSVSCVLQPELTVPAGASDLRIAADGTVSVRDPESGGRVVLGRIQLTRFTDPSTLVRVGNLFVTSDRTPSGLVGDPGSRGFGLVCSEMLEESNVDLANEVALGQRLHAMAQALRKVLALEKVPNEPLYFEPDMSAQRLLIP